MAPLFGRRPKSQVQDPSAERETLRRDWEVHMERMPPQGGGAPELVALQSDLAGLDVKGSRYVGAVLAGHADGLEPPWTEIQDLLAETHRLASQSEEAVKGEMEFHVNQLKETAALLRRAEKIATRRV